MANITLYGTPVSTYVRTVRLLLAYARIDYEIKDIGIFNGDNETDEYLNKNPFGKVPTVDFEGELVYETDAITFYINEKYANSQYSPSDLLLKARMYQIASIVNSYLYTPAIGQIVIQNLIVPQQGGEPNQTLIENAIAPAAQALKAIEDIVDDGSYLLGDSITIADLYLIPIFIYLQETPQFDTLTEQTPKLKAWWTHAQDLETVKEICS